MVESGCFMSVFELELFCGARAERMRGSNAKTEPMMIRGVTPSEVAKSSQPSCRPSALPSSAAIGPTAKPEPMKPSCPPLASTVALATSMA